MCSHCSGGFLSVGQTMQENAAEPRVGSGGGGGGVRVGREGGLIR